MRTLLDISDDLHSLMDLLDDLPGGEIDEATGKVLDEWFATLGAERNQKVDNYVAIVREMELRASVRRAEMERLQLRVVADENTAKRLRERLKMYMELSGEKKIETQRYRVAVQANGGKQALELLAEPEEFPIELTVTRVVTALKEEAVREAIAAGKDVPARLKPRGTHLRIS